MLCLRAPTGFTFYQSFEARSRFFAGMFWAGMAGIGGGLYLVGTVPRAPLSYAPALQMIVVSVTLVLAFGFQLRRVREQEARVLVTLFAALLQGEPGSAVDGRPEKPSEPSAVEEARPGVF
jgi:hypothetical protein